METATALQVHMPFSLGPYNPYWHLVWIYSHFYLDKLRGGRLNIALIFWTTGQVGAGHTKSSGAASDGIRGTKQVSVLLKRVLALLELCIVTYFGRLRNREWERMLSRKYAEAAFAFLSYEKCQMFHRWFLWLDQCAVPPPSQCLIYFSSFLSSSFWLCLVCEKVWVLVLQYISLLFDNYCSIME